MPITQMSELQALADRGSLKALLLMITYGQMGNTGDVLMRKYEEITSLIHFQVVFWASKTYSLGPRMCCLELALACLSQ